MTLHVIALPHTTLTEKDSTCAYSMKVLKFCGMMLDQGYEVILYGPDESIARCSEHVVITTEEDRVRWGFGGADGYDTALTPFFWDVREPYWREPNARVVAEIRRRVRPHDYLCLITSCQQPIANEFPTVTAVEWGVGYEGISTKFCAFESYAWMHHVYGILGIRNGRAFDRVIPNFFDPEDFIDPAVWQGASKADYLLYIGRVMERKGPHVAALIAQRLGLSLVVAGPGRTRTRNGRFATVEGVTLEGDVEYVGKVGFAERAYLMARARAVIVPTLYVEPFGGVAVEAMLSGTPVVASDWGSFTEIVTPEVGARFRTLAEGCAAVETVATLDPTTIRRHAIERYGLDAVGRQFTNWFEELDTLWDKGWYT